MPKIGASAKGGTGCTICANPARDAIDAAITSGALSLAKIATRYNVSPEALKRHRRNHPAADLAALREAPSMASSGVAADAHARLIAQERRALAAVKAATKTNSLNALEGAHREYRQTLDDLAKFELELAKVEALKTPPQVVSLTSNAQWLAIRQTVFDFFNFYAGGKYGWLGAELGGALDAIDTLTPDELAQWYERRKRSLIAINTRSATHELPPAHPATDIRGATRQPVRPVPARPVTGDASPTPGGRSSPNAGPGDGFPDDYPDARPDPRDPDRDRGPRIITVD